METSDPDDRSDAAGYLRAMAFHEAGHAVVAWSLDLPVGDIHWRKKSRAGTAVCIRLHCRCATTISRRREVSNLASTGDFNV
jgi:hypothetical protein